MAVNISHVPQPLPVIVETPAGDSAMDDANDAVRVNIVAGGSSGLTSAKSSHAVSTSVAPLGSATFNSSQITSATTGHLMKVIVAASVPWKAELQTVLNGTPSSNKAVWFSTEGSQDFLRQMITQTESATAGLDGFRVVVTNLDAARTADLYCTMFWDEI